MNSVEGKPVCICLYARKNGFHINCTQLHAKKRPSRCEGLTPVPVGERRSPYRYMW